MSLKPSTPLGYVQQTLTTVAALSTIPAGATYALLIPETNGLRWRDDGTNPTAAIGVPVAAGQSFIYDGDLSAIKVVSQTGTSTLSIAYFAAKRP